jgi:hypothetical protein
VRLCFSSTSLDYTLTSSKNFREINSGIPPEQGGKKMKYLKMLGLAAVAAAALMAFVGSSTASATVLCEVPGTGTTTGTTCPKKVVEEHGEKKEVSQTYPKGTVVKAQLVAGTVAKLETSFKTIECKKSTTEGETSAEEATQLTGPEGKLTFSECNCEVVVLHAGTVSTEWLAGTHNGTQRSSGSETTTTCSTLFGNVHCIYTTSNTDLGTLTGGNPAKLDASAEVGRLTTSAACAEKSLWKAEYEVTSPKPLYVAGHN